MSSVLQFSYAITIVFVCCSCVGSKPEWINELKDRDKYFIGLGVCSKSEKNYREIAFNKAEVEIARQLRVQTKSSVKREKKVVRSVTVQDKYIDLVQSDIQATLDEIEKLDEYQDKKNFYVLLGLNKEDYFQKKKKEKANAIDKVSQIIKNLDSLKIDRRLQELNEAINILFSKELIYEKDSSGRFIYNNLKNKLSENLDKLFLDAGASRLYYNPFLQNKLTATISVLYEGKLCTPLPIVIELDGAIISKLYSSDKKQTELVLEPSKKNEQIVKVILDQTIFGEKIDLLNPSDLTIGELVLDPIIGDLDISFNGPLNKDQKKRIESNIENFFFTRFQKKKTEFNESKVIVSVERSDQPKPQHNFPNISYISGSISISNGILENTFIISRTKGVDFESADRAYDKSISNLLSEKHLSMIFKQ